MPREKIEMPYYVDYLSILDEDGNVDATDVDLLFANLGSTDATFDLDSDGDADQQDVDRLVWSIMGKRYGDADFDQDVDIADANAVLTHYDPLGQNPFTGWSQGNFDGDGDV